MNILYIQLGEGIEEMTYSMMNAASKKRAPSGIVSGGDEGDTSTVEALEILNTILPPR